MTLEEMLQEAAKRHFDRLAEVGKKYGSIVATMHKDYNNKITVKFTCGDYSDDDKTTGACLDLVIDEYMRRKGWTERNKPMELIGNASMADDDGVEIISPPTAPSNV